MCIRDSIKRIPMTEMSAAQFRQVIDVDLNAPFIVAKAIIPDTVSYTHLDVYKRQR